MQFVDGANYYYAFMAVMSVLASFVMPLPRHRLALVIYAALFLFFAILATIK